MKKMRIVTNQLDLTTRHAQIFGKIKFWGRSLRYLAHPPMKTGDKFNARTGSLGHCLVKFKNLQGW